MTHKGQSRRKRNQKSIQELFDDTLRDAVRKNPELGQALALSNAGLPDMVGKTTPQYRRMMD